MSFLIGIILTSLAMCLISVKLIINKSRKQPIIIAIEGNIGVGKTTFLDILKSIKSIANKAKFVSEPVDVWLKNVDKDGKNILGKFYENKERWSYTFQNVSFITKALRLADVINQIMSSKLFRRKNIIFSDRSIGTDKNVFAKMLYDDKLLSDLEYKWYNEWCSIFDKYILKHSKKNIIYLKCDPTTAYNRIQKRGRSEEKTISLEYLTKLHNYHEQWIAQEIQQGTNVLVVNWNADLNENEIKQYVIKRVPNFIKKL